MVVWASSNHRTIPLELLVCCFESRRCPVEVPIPKQSLNAGEVMIGTPIREREGGREGGRERLKTASGFLLKKNKQTSIKQKPAP